MEEIEIKAHSKEQLIKALVRLRKQAGKTQLELSELTGLPQSSISKLESESREPSLSIIFRVLSALGLEIVIRPKRKLKSKNEGIVI
jgi:HTH-type transcriptional regulator / antitoxin HipB